MHRSDVIQLARSSRSFEPPEPGTTRDTLITTAERLFAERGIEGVSLRTICVESKQGNTRALQYHFNDRDGIVNAILLTRMRQIENRRAELLTEAVARGKTDIPALIEILLRPMSEFISDDGRNLFARFLSHMLTHTHIWTWGRRHAPVLPETERTGTQQAYDLLAGQLPALDGDHVQKRMAHILRMFLGALIDRENTILDGGKEASLERTIQEQLVMGAAALTAPVPAALATV